MLMKFITSIEKVIFIYLKKMQRLNNKVLTYLALYNVDCKEALMTLKNNPDYDFININID